MPKPEIEKADIVETVKEAVFLMRVGNPDIDIALDLPDEPITVAFDRRLISQAVTNVVKNATEAIGAVTSGGEGARGEISVSVGEASGWATIDAVDNGIGLPDANRHRLLEPYMTTREKGTGLGLAIVSRIMEEHGGRVELADSPAVAHGGRGAWVRLTLPVDGNGGSDGSGGTAPVLDNAVS